MFLAAILLLQAQKPLFTIGGDTIALDIPTWTAALSPLPSAEYEGHRYTFRSGKLVSKSRKGGGWDEVSTPIPPSNPKVVPMLFQMVYRIDLQTDIGHLLQRQGDIYTDDWRNMKREVALFCYLVRQYTEGKTEIEPTWRVDETLLFMDDEDWSSRAPKYLSPIVNATSEKPSEGPGPFKATFVLHPGFGSAIQTSNLDGAPVVSVPVYTYFDRLRAGQLARAMFNGWVATSGSLAPRTVRIPTPVGSGPLPLYEPGDWNAPASELKGEVGKEPLEPGINRRTLGGKPVLVVGPPFAKIVADKLKLNSLGWIAAQESTWVVFPGDGVPIAQTDASLLGVHIEETAGPLASPEVGFGPGETENLPASGSFIGKTVADPERGSVGEIREFGLRRSGWIRLMGRVDVSKTPFLEFMVKPRGGVLPLNLVVDADGVATAFRLFGAASGPRILPEESSIPIALQAKPEWQKVVLDLRMVGAKGFADGIYLAPPASSTQAPVPRAQAGPALLFDDLAVRSEASGPLAGIAATALMEGASPTAEDPFARARFAHETADVDALLKLLDDPYDLVRHNAADRFRTLKDPRAVPKLTEIGRHFNPRLAQAGTLALGNQGGETAIQAIRYNFQTALGDFSKLFGAQVMPPIQERKILADLSVGLHAKHPLARCEVVRALARQPFKEAPLVMMTFLNDTEPTVRLAVIESLPAKDSTVLARVIGTARNDPSDDVRAAAFRRLREWGAPEAAESAKDPSPRVNGQGSL